VTPTQLPYCQRAGIQVDGAVCLHAIGQAGGAGPGSHTIRGSSGEIGFEIPAGVVYRINYWGPYVSSNVELMRPSVHRWRTWAGKFPVTPFERSRPRGGRYAYARVRP
jgi:hypothetical protein